MLSLRLSDKTIDLNTHSVEGKVLYKAQDLLVGYGFSGRKVSDTVRNWIRSVEKKSSRQIDVLVLRGGASDKQGTYLTKRQIMQLSGFVSYDFEEAVYTAFEHAVNGDGDKAVEAAWGVVRKEGKEIRKEATKVLGRVVGLNPEGYRQATNHLTKIATGETASEIKANRTVIGKRGKPVKVKSARDAMTLDELTKVSTVEQMLVYASTNDKNVFASLSKVERAFELLK